MATPVAFGGGNPVLVDVNPAGNTNGPWICPDTDVLDVGLFFGATTMSLSLLSYTGTSPELTLLLETAMDVKFTQAYSLGMFTALSSTDSAAGNQRDAREFRRLQRYLRWKVTTKGSATSFTFLLQGILYQAR